jgi:hypothetical protein
MHCAHLLPAGIPVPKLKAFDAVARVALTITAWLRARLGGCAGLPYRAA